MATFSLSTKWTSASGCRISFSLTLGRFKSIVRTPDVIMMDCTCRTNRFNMPLLNIVGVTGMNTTIHIAQVFIRGEKECDYTWAATQLKAFMIRYEIEFPQVIFTDRDLTLLNALESTLPGVPALLCIWHIVRDVESHARTNTFRRQKDPSSQTETPKMRDSAAHRNFCDAFLRLVRSTTEAEYWLRRQELYALSRRETRGRVRRRSVAGHLAVSYRTMLD